MAVQNAEIARLLRRVADLLEIQEANPFRVRAYRAAARTVEGSARALHAMVRDGEDLSALPAIGEDLAGKIGEIVETGHLSLLDELGEETPTGLVELLTVPGLGPRRVHALQAELGVTGRADLLRAAREGRVRAVRGFGEKTEKKLLAALRAEPAAAGRTRWIDAEPVALDLVRHLRGAAGVDEVVVAGSFRRRKETVGDLDVLVTCRRETDAGALLAEHEDVAEVVARGKTKTTVRLRSGLQVDLRVVPRASYGAALVYFTGSKAHNLAVRRLGVDKGLKINEYGVFRGEERVTGRTEHQVYRSVGLRYVEPELREDRGEIDAARRGRLPTLVDLEDVRGDLHVHTTASDGRSTVEEMARAAEALGYDYLAVTDHTRAARIAHGLDARRMRRHLRHVEAVDGKVRGIRLLRSAEVDILPDGKLDLPADLLDELDLVVGAVHSGFGLSRERQTARLLRAMDHPRFHVLAHPTGRLLEKRPPVDVDLERVVAGAAERGCFLELNAQPSRLDLPDAWCKAAREAGVKIAVSTDAHSAAQLELMRVGIGYARRGWLEKEDVLNTRSWGVLKRLLRR